MQLEGEEAVTPDTRGDFPKVAFNHVKQCIDKEGSQQGAFILCPEPASLLELLKT